MTDEELLELESLLESPDIIDELTENDFHQLAGTYHRAQLAKITKKILEDLNAQHDLSEKAIKSHKDYPLYRHHADEAVRHHNACSEEVNEETGNYHKEALGIVRKHSGLESSPEKADTDEGTLHLHAASPSSIKELHKHLSSSGFEKQPTLSKPEMGVTSGGGGDGPIYHHFIKGNTHVYVSNQRNTFGYAPTNDLTHHHVEIYTHGHMNEEIVEMPDEKERFSKMMSPKLDDVLRSASKALAGKILSPEEQLRGTFND